MSVTRRNALGAAVVAAIAPSIVRQGQAAQPAATDQAPGFYRFKVGDLQVTAINDGVAFRPLDGFIKNAPEADVKQALAAAFLPSDKMTIPFTTLVVNSGSKLVLLDTGNGNSGAPTSGTWMANFKAAGFDPANVDTILISHFHGDHINGMRLKDGTAVFPKAEVMVPAPEWGFWMDDAKMAAAPDGLKPNFQNVRRVFGPMAKDIKQFEWGKEPVTGITTIAAPGHTPGHTAFAIASGSGKLMVMSDTTNNPALFVRNPDWQAVFDMNGPEAAATRRKMLDMAATDKMQVSFYHASFPATGFIAKEGTGFQMVPVSWAPSI
ncbi:MAG: MBL fold metallo-hydrolase [Acetobacteraceae bacterium]|nr:MBL fold metallo-hydrolase [Acetobacteraceae bacterium]